MKKLLLGLLPILSFAANAGDDPVNCRSQNVTEVYYHGTAECRAANGVLVREEFHNSSTYWVWASDYKGNRCYTSLPFQSTRTVSTKVCDYTPSATFSFIRLDGYEATTLISLNGTDRDGEIVKYEFWVDGVKQPNSGYSLQIDGNDGDTFYVKGRVTDNDGYTYELARTFDVRYREPARCGRHFC
ncbi:hypothetical protein ACSLBF_11145 [Pseudoalteromonas sp. T1lg65]|uniref:hypothetical protein n=1 Tax=Pseudoalteromonas sp. T1lg65 TaxID=2077101 RepID=UPI003F7967CD